MTALTTLLHIPSDGRTKDIATFDTGRALHDGVGGYFEVIAFDWGDLWVPDDNQMVPWMITENGDRYQPVNEIATALVVSLSPNTLMAAGCIIGDAVLSGPADAEGETTSVTAQGRALVEHTKLAIAKAKARLRHPAR